MFRETHPPHTEVLLIPMRESNREEMAEQAVLCAVTSQKRKHIVSANAGLPYWLGASGSSPQKQCIIGLVLLREQPTESSA